MTNDLIDYQKAYEEEQREKRNNQQVKQRQWKELQQNTEMLKPIVDMKDAYAQVVAELSTFSTGIEYRFHERFIH